MIRTTLLLAVQIAAQPVPAPTQPGDLPGLADAFISARVAADSFSGVVLVARHGKVQYQRAAGLADRERNIAMQPDTRLQIASPGPHGGATSTAEDLVRFAAALIGGRLVSPAMLKQLTEPQVGTGRSLGFQIGGDAAAAYFGHGGGAPGMNSTLRVFPGLGYSVVVLSNYDSGANLAGAYITEVLR